MGPATLQGVLSLSRILPADLSDKQFSETPG